MEDILGLVFFGSTDSVNSISLKFDILTILKKTRLLAVNGTNQDKKSCLFSTLLTKYKLHGLYQKYNRDKNVIKDRVITLVNTVDAIYQRINIRIVLKYLEIWTNRDPFGRVRNAGSELRNFRAYRNKHLIYQRINIRIVLKYLEIWTNRDPFGRVRNAGSELRNFRAYRNKHLVKRFPHDNALLLSHKSWPPNIAGLAWVNSMCGGNSNSINAWSYSSSVGPYVIVAHELGHNFAFNHDTVFNVNEGLDFQDFRIAALNRFKRILLTEFLYDVLSNNSTLALRGRKKEWFTFIIIEY
ncbi:hypothetical protein pdam_00021307 [Pocillopora damicornis]|uniref:Peptidase M12B domain-containing protein n=1 Tax=Pocillopora damicornis TaxID=46731 RepID=A0A3M6UUK0_POCDA|nr:hypothetical protein pdam_00021307 [Pocillopora damicornis]